MKGTLTLAIALLIGAGLTTPVQASANSCAKPSCGTASTSTHMAKHHRYAMSRNEFISMAARDNLAETEYAKLASERGSSPEVREFATRILDERHKISSSLDQLAAKDGVKLPTTLSKTRERELKRLEKLSSAKFDSEFLRQVAYLRSRDLSSFGTEVKASHDTGLRSWIHEALPIVKAELPKPTTTHAVR